MYSFALSLKGSRLKKKFKQEELAKKIEVNPSTISLYETGRRKPDIETLMMLSEALDVSIDQLVGNTFGDFFSTDDKYLIEVFNSLEKRSKDIVFHTLIQESYFCKHGEYLDIRLAEDVIKNLGELVSAAEARKSSPTSKAKPDQEE